MNFKLKCIKNWQRKATAGKIYTFVDGVTTWDNGYISLRYLNPQDFFDSNTDSVDGHFEEYANKVEQQVGFFVKGTVKIASEGEIGNMNRVFYKGKIYSIVGETQGNKYLLYDFNKIGNNNTIVVNMRKVEPICNEVFKVGDHVRAIMQDNRGFTGYVTGYEFETNRVVCSSARVVQSRVRYAYKVNELERVPSAMEFKLNGYYKSKSGECYRVVQTADGWALINDKTGLFACYVEAATHLSRLVRYEQDDLSTLSHVPNPHSIRFDDGIPF